MYSLTPPSNNLCEREHGMTSCCKGSLAFLPVLWAAWTMVCLIISFSLAVSLGHTHAFLPFISQTSMMNPEYIFSAFACTITSILGAAIVYAEYKYINIYHSNISRKWNKILLCWGLLSYLGFLIAAYVSVLVAFSVHLAGAIGGFGLNCLYNFSHTILCLQSSVWQDNKQMVIVRLCFSVGSLAFLLMIGFTKMMCVLLMSCTQSDMNFSHAVFEWLTTFGICGYILTFTKDFQRLRLTYGPVISKNWMCEQEKSINAVESVGELNARP
ncbi:hypothetical protein XENTR_v10019276 [Xenopus tropicalis]|uniref:DNA damage-regulated autophagy modulator protein 1 n=1 Tax=Xenopus tropicalis TaxID=8364 RepID=A0A803K5J5_XENTR|eukprot:XP_017951282.1 PREDICTED: DNA damage-regulated autophagy modulator protein 1-like [Xenopus tropicalis]